MRWLDAMTLSNVHRFKRIDALDWIRMAARSTPGRATYEDIMALPKNHVGEILFGVLHAPPRPALPHAEVASALGVEVRGPFHGGRGGPGGWIILDEPELHVGADPDIVVPDLAGWRRI